MTVLVVAAPIIAAWWLFLARPVVRHHRHRRCLERIARLELSMAIGLYVGREYLKARRPHVTFSGHKRECWGCGKEYWYEERTGGPERRELGEHLCWDCLKLANAELAAL